MSAWAAEHPWLVFSGFLVVLVVLEVMAAFRNRDDE